MPVDYAGCLVAMENAFMLAEEALLANERQNVQSQATNADLGIVFASRTQAFREALMGCILVRISDRSIDITKPYVAQGENAFSGRTLDEQVVNPVLQQRRIPSSRGPYLSVFRRSIELNLATRDGVRDKNDYDALLRLLGHVAGEVDNERLISLLGEVAYRFLILREEGNIPLNRIQRMSLDQVTRLVRLLLETPSGGRLPMFIVVATLEAVKATLNLDWQIEWEDINVADAASGLSGDVVVSRNGQTLIAAEVTEREVDRNRVVATFNNKIGPNPMDDYLFFVRSEVDNPETLQQIRQYFAQGHEINFVVVDEWVQSLLATVGVHGRAHFITGLITLLEREGVPVALRVAWNNLVDRVIGEA